jgi:hypothetical protein
MEVYNATPEDKYTNASQGEVMEVYKATPEDMYTVPHEDKSWKFTMPPLHNLNTRAAMKAVL